MNRFPISVDLTGKPVVLVGKGPQIREKKEKLLPFGPVLLEQETFTEADAQKRPVMVVVGDTPEKKAEAIAEVCARYHIPVNVVDVPRLCSFYFPALITRGDLTVSLSTGGSSPAMTACLRRSLEGALPAQTEALLDWAAENRARFKAMGVLSAAVSAGVALGRPLTEEELLALKADGKA